MGFVKICGICSESDASAIVAMGPDALGFVFWPKSKRYIDPVLVGQWDTGAVKRVGVFVDPSESELRLAVAQARLDVIQIHRRDASYNPVLPSDFAGEFWWATDPRHLDRAMAGKADRILLDAFDPKVVGGTGRTCDWEKAKGWVEAFEKPVILAGGLTVGNVRKAIEQVMPWGIDVSSGVEREPGKKDLASVAEFLRHAR